MDEDEGEWTDSDDESDASSRGYDSDMSSGAESGAGGWSFSKSRVGNFLQSISGNKVTAALASIFPSKIF